MPKVSVIIPTYNCGKYICEAIDSVLAQTYKDFEIIVVDDGSTDNTNDIVGKYIKEHPDKIKYFYKDNGGEASARNFGIQKTDSEYLAFLDADDVWLPDKLEIQYASIVKSGAGLNYTAMIVVDEHGKSIGEIKPSKPALCVVDLIKGYRIPMTVLIRTELFGSIGLFDENIKVAVDTDLWIRFARHIKIEYISAPLAKYRRHESNISSNISEAYIGHTKIFSKLISNPPIGISKEILKQKLARECYLLAKEYYLEKKYGKALKNVVVSLRMYPLVGRCFVDFQDSILKKTKKLIMPYLALACYLLMWLISREKLL